MNPIWRIACVCSILVGALLTLLAVVLAIQSWQSSPLLGVGCICMGIPPMSLAACAWWALTKEPWQDYEGEPLVRTGQGDYERRYPNK